MSVSNNRLSVPSARGFRYPRYSWVALCALLCLAGRPAHADISLSLDKKDADTVSDMATLVAHADSPDGIDKVEFKVDSRILFTGVSVPYSFLWDTIGESEGPHTLTVTAYDSKGATKAVAVSLVVDNQLGVGAVALAKKGFDALAAHDLDTAFNYARRASKAAPGTVPGARILAAVYGSRADWDKAIAALDNISDIDTDPHALLELASYRMRRALHPENSAGFFAELERISELRRRAGDIIVRQVTAANTPKGGDSVQSVQAVGDALVSAGRYLEACNTYSRFALASAASAPIMNRYALATILDGRADEVLSLLSDALAANRGDAITRTVYGLALVRVQKFGDALVAIKPVMINRPISAVIVSAFAHVGLGDRKTATIEALEAVNAAPRCAEAQYALALASVDSVQSDDALSKALALASHQPGPILLFGVNPLFRMTEDPHAVAMKTVELALKIDANDINANLMKALLLLQADKLTEAGSLLHEMKRTDKLKARTIGQAPDLQIVDAIYWDKMGDSHQMLECLDQARQIDSSRFIFTSAPKPDDLRTILARRLQYRTDAFLTLGLLYPPTAP